VSVMSPMDTVSLPCDTHTVHTIPESARDYNLKNDGAASRKEGAVPYRDSSSGCSIYREISPQLGQTATLGFPSRWEKSFRASAARTMPFPPPSTRMSQPSTISAPQRIHLRMLLPP